ncbi:MAG: 1,4-dihydroxy-2-naphthoate polyprenyltransferase [Chloroflexota bacterium]
MVPKNKIDIWILAIRPKTLPAAAAPVVVGAALAFSSGYWLLLPAIAALIAALLLQIGSNLANDVFDYEKGADSGERLGPLRVTQAGLLTPEDVKRGMLVVFGLAVIIGVYLIYHAGWVILIIGLAAVFSAVAYTGGPYPLGYHGLGDLFVFIFFGLVATVGTFYIQTGTTTSTVWWMGAAIGLLILNVLVVNNLRDLDNDRLTGKRTLAVRLGKKGARLEYWMAMVGAYFIPALLFFLGDLSVGGLSVFISIPIALKLARSIYLDSGKNLNRTLADTGKLGLIYALLFAVGVCWF